MQVRERRIAWISSVIAAIVPGLALLAHPVPGVRTNPGIQTVFIPTRDGVSLATDLYFPFNHEKLLPAVLIRTPYSRRTFPEFYLASETGANTTKGDGKLQRLKSGSSKELDSYIYDPGDPTSGVTSRMRRGGTKGYTDITATRKDILVFDTAPLDEPLNIAGPVSIKLHASTSARDTDWIAYLAALDESGTLVPLGRGMGIIRARFRTFRAADDICAAQAIILYGSREPTVFSTSSRISHDLMRAFIVL